MNVEVPSADAEPDYCGDMTRRVCQVGEAMMCDCPGGGQSAQFCNTTCSAWMPCKCHIDSKNREVQPKGSSLMMGDRCDCRLNGRPIVTNDGPGYCIDGVAVDERSYEKLSKDPKFVYTKCPDPRKDGGK
ncbi:MAG: hypothetical protein PHC70_03860 [Patescibacteria group bacterium]|nr:hypothetical protein [Patescibacteria group bacterium]